MALRLAQLAARGKKKNKKKGEEAIDPDRTETQSRTVANYNTGWQLAVEARWLTKAHEGKKEAQSRLDGGE